MELEIQRSNVTLWQMKPLIKFLFDLSVTPYLLDLLLIHQHESRCEGRAHQLKELLSSQKRKNEFSPHTFEDKGQLISSRLKQTPSDVNF